MKKLLILSALFLFFGCATTPINVAAIEDTQEFHASFNSIWSTLVASVSEMGLEIENIDKDSGLLSTKKYVFIGSNAPNRSEQHGTIDEWVYPPSIAAQLLGGGWKEAGYRLTILVTLLDENSTKIKVIAIWDGTTTSGTPYKMQSKGAIEKKLFDSIRAKL